MNKELDCSIVCGGCEFCPSKPKLDDNLRGVGYVVIAEVKPDTKSKRFPISLHKVTPVENFTMEKSDICPIRMIIDGNYQHISLVCPKGYAAKVG